MPLWVVMDSDRWEDVCQPMMMSPKQLKTLDVWLEKFPKDIIFEAELVTS